MTSPPDLVLGTDFLGLVLRPRERVAMVREEHAGRLEVLADDGALYHRPGPLATLAGPPFVEVGPGTLVDPRHVHLDGNRLALPGGWTLEARLPREAPPPPAPADDPLLPGDVRASEVLWVETGGTGAAFWITDRGRIPGPKGLRTSRLARHHPRLLQVVQTRFVNPLRVAALRRNLGGAAGRCRLHFDEGTVMDLPPVMAMRTARALGAENYDWVGGETPAQAELRYLGARRWPKPLLEAEAGFLSSEFPGQPARLLTNLALETVEAARRGEPVPNGHRSWYYTVARGALQRAGHLERDGDWARDDEEVYAAFEEDQRPGLVPTKPLRRRSAEYTNFGLAPPLDRHSAWVLVCTVWPHLVDELRLFTYREAGFLDQKPEARRLGRTRPALVVLVEKDSLLGSALVLHERFGVTLIVLGGLPTVIGSEYLAADLAAAGVREVRLVSYCDFDLAGWDIPVMQAAHLARYGLPTAGIRRLVTPDRFTPEELARLSVPLDTSRHPIYRSRLKRFLEETGGIQGQPRGIDADHLAPAERVAEAFTQLAADWLAAPPGESPPPGHGEPGPRG